MCLAILELCCTLGEDEWDTCTHSSLSANQPLILKLFCGKWPIKMRQAILLRHLVLARLLRDATMNMGWLRLVGSFKLQVSFAKEPYKRDDILQERPMIVRSLLIVATPYHLHIRLIYILSAQNWIHETQNSPQSALALAVYALTQRKHKRYFRLHFWLHVCVCRERLRLCNSQWYQFHLRVQHIRMCVCVILTDSHSQKTPRC